MVDKTLLNHINTALANILNVLEERPKDVNFVRDRVLYITDSLRSVMHLDPVHITFEKYSSPIEHIEVKKRSRRKGVNI